LEQQLAKPRGVEWLMIHNLWSEILGLHRAMGRLQAARCSQGIASRRKVHDRANTNGLQALGYSVQWAGCRPQGVAKGLYPAARCSQGIASRRKVHDRANTNGLQALGYTVHHAPCDGLQALGYSVQWDIPIRQ
jgi:hypothetical protein